MWFGDGSPHVNLVSLSKLIPLYGETVTLCAGHRKNTNGANGLLLAHAAKNKVTLTNIHAALVDHVTVREMNDLISFSSQRRYVVLHHHLRLLSKCNDVVWTHPTKFVDIKLHANKRQAVVV